MSAAVLMADLDIRRLTNDQRTVSTTKVDVVHPVVKSLLDTGNRKALCNFNSLSSIAHSNPTINDKISGTGDEDFEIEAMHFYDDEEDLYQVPDEFKLDDEHFEVFRNVCGVRLQREFCVAVLPSIPPEFALPAELDLVCAEEDFVQLFAMEKPIPIDQLRHVPMD